MIAEVKASCVNWSATVAFVVVVVVVVATGRDVVDLLVERGADVCVGAAAVPLLPHATRHSMVTERHASRVTGRIVGRAQTGDASRGE